MEDCINSDLANNFENLCQRVTAFAIKNCKGKIPKEIEFVDDDLKILNRFSDNMELIRNKIDNLDLNFYIDFIVNALFLTNILMIKNLGKKDNIKRLNTIVYTTFEIVRKISFLLSNNPTICNKCSKNFFNKEKEIDYSSISNNNYLIGDNKINKIDILFKKIERNND